MSDYKIKALLKKNKANKEGQIPIYICITVNGERSYTSTGYYVYPNQ